MLLEKNNWFDNFLKELYAKYPKRHDLVQALMDLLLIEREAVYRRLRKDVIFTAHEVVKIATSWSISLDEVISVNSEFVTFQMRKVNFVNPSEGDSNFLRLVIQGIKRISAFPNTELMDICNKLPRQLLAGYPYLNQFHLFKRMYKYGDESEIVPFSQVIVSDEKIRITNEYNEAIKTVSNSNFIFDRMLFDYLVSDIQYFHSIRMINDEDRENIKNDLTKLLNYLFEIANKGCYPETQKKVNLFISQLHTDTNYNYVYSPDLTLCFIHIFEKYDIYTYNADMAKKFREWMLLKKRSSIQISEVDVRSRIEYFERQHDLVKKAFG